MVPEQTRLRVPLPTAGRASRGSSRRPVRSERAPAGRTLTIHTPHTLLTHTHTLPCSSGTLMQHNAELHHQQQPSSASFVFRLQSSSPPPGPPLASFVSRLLHRSRCDLKLSPASFFCKISPPSEHGTDQPVVTQRFIFLRL